MGGADEAAKDCDACGSDCSTVDTAEAAEEAVYARAVQLEDIGYRPGRVLRRKAAYFGSPECPSVGSAGHNRGLCTPCDFAIRRGGCKTGAACKFCHLCDFEENKCHRQEKRKLIRAMKADRGTSSRFGFAPAVVVRETGGVAISFGATLL